MPAQSAPPFLFRSRWRRVALIASMCAVTLIPAVPAGAADGTWDRAWGKDVDAVAPSTGFEVCTVAPNCKAAVGGGTLGGELKQPRGVATDPAGNVWVADSDNNRLQKFTSTGAFLFVMGKDVDTAPGTDFEICTVAANCKIGSPSGGLGGTFAGPTSVGTDADGNVYVGDLGSVRVQKFNSAGTFLRTWGRDVDNVAPAVGFEICTVAANCKAGSSGSPGGSFASTLNVAVGGGKVYVTDVFNNRIQKFDTEGAFERAWGKAVDSSLAGDGFEICTVAANCTFGDGAGGLGGTLNAAHYLAADAAGNVYTGEQGNNRIQRFDADGAFQRAWGRDVDSNAVGTGFEICTVAGSCKAAAAATGPGGELYGPNGLAADTAGNVYVSEVSAPRIQRFDASGAFERAWGKDVDTAAGTGFEICTVAASCKAGQTGGLGGEIGGSANGLATDAAGNLYVVDYSVARIQRFADAVGVSRTLAVSTSGVGAGAVTGSGIDCGGAGHTDCSETVADGASITLTATAASGSSFTGFSGGGCGATSPCTVTMDADKTVGAGFAVEPVVIPPKDEPAPEPARATPPPAATLPVVAAALTQSPLAAPIAVTAAQLVTFPATRKCVSRRSFRIRLRVPRGVGVRRAVVLVNGKRVQTIRGARLRAPVNLRTLPRGRFTVAIAVTLVDGRTVRGTRRYRTCAKKQRAGRKIRV